MAKKLYFMNPNTEAAYYTYLWNVTNIYFA